MAIMYGLWLRFALDSKKINVEVAIRITKDLTHSRLRAYTQTLSKVSGN